MEPILLQIGISNPKKCIRVDWKQAVPQAKSNQQNMQRAPAPLKSRPFRENKVSNRKNHNCPRAPLLTVLGWKFSNTLLNPRRPTGSERTSDTNHYGLPVADGFQSSSSTKKIKKPVGKIISPNESESEDNQECTLTNMPPPQTFSLTRHPLRQYTAIGTRFQNLPLNHNPIVPTHIIRR